MSRKNRRRDYWGYYRKGRLLIPLYRLYHPARSYALNLAMAGLPGVTEGTIRCASLLSWRPRSHPARKGTD